MLLSISSNVYSKGIDLECPALDFTVQSELNRALAPGEIRSPVYALAGFLNTDDYALKVTTQCEGKKEQKVCISLSDSHYCPKPKANFRVKSIGSSDTHLMIKNRCTGEWSKFTKISSTETSENYLPDEVFFQLKNQIYSGINIAEKPILKLNREEVGSPVSIELTSFTRDLWHINQFDPLVGTLKVNPEGYEKDLHSRFSITGTCSGR